MKTTDPSFGVHLGVIPYDRSYWVVPGRLLAGFYPAAKDPAETDEKLTRLLDVGVGHVVNLTEANEGLTHYHDRLGELARARDLTVTHRRMAIVDLDIPTEAFMAEILDEIDHHLEAGRRVYVHCWGGRGRTGTVVGCWLARHGMATGDELLAMIRYLRRTDGKAWTEAPETQPQKNFAARWTPGR